MKTSPDLRELYRRALCPMPPPPSRLPELLFIGLAIVSGLALTAALVSLWP